jgi:adenylate kinase
METIIVNIKGEGKATILIEMLKSLDFVSSVDYIDKMKKTRRLFDEVNQLASETELAELTMDDIIDEIKTYRLEKKSNSH